MKRMKGIKATTKSGKEYFFDTEIQSDVETEMTNKGYGCEDYNLSFFEMTFSTMGE